MAVAQVTCTVCGSTINKRQTLQVGADRVCRSHPEAVDHKEKIVQEAYAEHARRKERSDKVAAYTRHIRVTARSKGLNIHEAMKVYKEGVPEELRTEVLNKVKSLGPITDTEWEREHGSDAE